jgi:hypothetical protein
MTEVVNKIQNKNLTFRNSFNTKVTNHITQLYESRFRLQGRQHRSSGYNLWHNSGNVIEYNVLSP